MRRVFDRFLEEIEDSKKAFRNYLTFSKVKNSFQIFVAFSEYLTFCLNIKKWVHDWVQN